MNVASRSGRLGSLVAALSVLFGVSQAHAARVARVAADSVEIYADADPSSAVLGTAAKNDPLAVSNEPFAGFHKVRTSDGKVGWIALEALNLAPESAPPGSGGAGAQANALGAAGVGTTSAAGAREGSNEGIEGGFRTLVFGGGALFAPATVNTALGITGYRSAFEVGVEAAFDLGTYLALVLRAEYLIGNFVLTDAESLSTYNMGTQAVPLTIGFDWSPVQSSRFRLGVMAGAGVSPVTLLYSQALNESGSNVTLYSGFGTTALGKLVMEVPLARSFGLFLEGGYRWLATAAMPPSATANGSEIFMDPDSGEARALDLDYSGPVANGGLVFRF